MIFAFFGLPLSATLLSAGAVVSAEAPEAGGGVVPMPPVGGGVGVADGVADGVAVAVAVAVAVGVGVPVGIPGPRR